MILDDFFDQAVITLDDEAALSEGFCPRCHSSLRLPVWASDGGPDSIVVSATQCSGCKTVYLR